MNAKKYFMLLGSACLVAATLDSSNYRFAWVLFGLSYIIAVDLIKDVEKAKAKERALTEIRMKQEMLEGWDASLGERYELMIDQITKTSDTLLKQLATYVRTGVPDRTCETCENTRLHNERSSE